MIRSFTEPTVFIDVDASLSGAGAICQDVGYLAYSWPQEAIEQAFPINALECYNLMIAVKCFAPYISGKTVAIRCDNSATVSVVGSGKGANDLMDRCQKEIWRVTSIYDAHVMVIHHPGEDLTIADLLSRVFTNNQKRKQFDHFRAITHLPWMSVPITHLWI